MPSDSALATSRVVVVPGVASLDRPSRRAHSRDSLADRPRRVVPRSHDRVVVLDFTPIGAGRVKRSPRRSSASCERGSRSASSSSERDAARCAPVMEQLRISSLPTVMGMSRGRFVDQFRGSVPEEEVARFVDALIADLESGRDAGGETEAAETEATEGRTVAWMRRR